ncbi:MAG: sigma-70 family RNA polymerase sigma factor [Polyangiales bacterium]|nr:sigma-70 family RNA polymerase sigma factor [Sandaracinaceae bacterium]
MTTQDDERGPQGAEARGREAAELVAAAKAGDQRAFEALVIRYRPRIYALALHLTGSPSDADDITQDAFLRAYARLPEFEGRSQFFTWLYRIALHRALNIKRNRGRRPTTPLDDPRITAAVAVDAAGDPARTLELQEAYGHLLAAFDRLSPMLRTTVVLTTLQGLNYSEAAVVLDTTEGTIAWRVHEARKKLRDEMTRLLKDPTPVEAKRRARRISHMRDRPEMWTAAIGQLLGDGNGHVA